MATIFNTVSMEGITFFPLFKFKVATENGSEGNILFDSNFDFSKIIPESKDIYIEKDKYIELAIETLIRKLEKSENISKYFSHRMSDKDYYETLESYKMERMEVPGCNYYVARLSSTMFGKNIEKENRFSNGMSDEECCEKIKSYNPKILEKLEKLGTKFLTSYLRDEPITRKDWRMKNWGTAENATETKVVERGFTISFRTSNPPIPVIKKLSEQHPNARVSYCYSEEDAAEGDCITKQYVGEVETGEFIKIKVDFEEPSFIENETFVKKYGYTDESPLIRNKDTGECIYILFDSMLAWIRKEHLNEFYRVAEELHATRVTPVASVLNITENELYDLYELKTDDIKKRIVEERDKGLDDIAIAEKLTKEVVIYRLGNIEKTGFLDIEKKDEYTAKKFIRSVMESI